MVSGSLFVVRYCYSAAAHQALGFVPHAVGALFDHGDEAVDLAGELGGADGLLKRNAGGGEVGETGQGVEALCGLGGVVCPLREEEAAPAEGVEGVAVEDAVWGEAGAADDGGGVEGLAKVLGLAAICFARIGFAGACCACFSFAETCCACFSFAETCCACFSFAETCCACFSFAETRCARFQVALEWGGQLGADLRGVEEVALLLQFGGFAKQGVGGVEALEIVGCCAAVVFTGEFEVVGGGVEQAEEVGSAEGLAAFAADGVVTGDELAMGGVG